MRAFFEAEKPDQVYLAAAKVGGIHANNTYPAEFIYQNLMMEANVIDAAFRNGVKKRHLVISSGKCRHRRDVAADKCSPSAKSGLRAPRPYPQEAKQMTVLSARFIEQGMQQGMLQGMQQGEEKVLERLLTRRFGHLSEATRNRPKSANTDQLERWADNTLDAQTLDDVFKEDR